MSALTAYKHPLTKVTPPTLLTLPYKDDANTTLAAYALSTPGGMTTVDAIIANNRIRGVSTSKQSYTTIRLSPNHTLIVFADRSVLIGRNETIIPLPLKLPERLEKTTVWDFRTLCWREKQTHNIRPTYITLDELANSLKEAVDFWQAYAYKLPTPWNQDPDTLEAALAEQRLFPWTAFPLTTSASLLMLEVAQLTGAMVLPTLKRDIPLHGLYVHGYSIDWSGPKRHTQSDWINATLTAIWDALSTDTEKLLKEYDFTDKGATVNANIYITPGHMRQTWSKHALFDRLDKIAHLDLPTPETYAL